MNAYLRWSLRQLYLIFFWPKEFTREVESFGLDGPKLSFVERVQYCLKLFPLLLALCALASLIAGNTCEASGLDYDWAASWVNVARSLGFSAAYSVMTGPALGVALGIAFSVPTGVGGGVSSDVLKDMEHLMAFDVAFGVASGVALGIVFGMAFGVRRSRVAGVASGIVLGMAISVGHSMAVGVASGMVLGASSSLALWLTYFRLLTYPFDVALSGFAYLTARRRPRAVASAWRWCPVAWNEVLWLPLPYVDKLLALLVQQDRNEGFEQISFVAINRPLQFRVALAALIEVAVTDLRVSSLTELANVTEKFDWTTDALPELDAVVPRIDRIAQHVGQYLALHSPYRKSEALSRAVKEIDALQRSLIAAPGRFAPRLLQTANEWRRMLEAEQDMLRAQTAAKREIPNPFRFGNPIEETEQNVFTGRRDLVRRIEESVLGAAHSPTLLLHGPRRMGKTSILNQLPRLLGPDFAPAVLDCQNPAVRESPATLLRYLSRTLSDGLKRRRVAVEPLTLAALQREPFAAFDEWLDGVERAMPPQMRALLCLDEYEHLKTALNAGWGAELLDALRHTLQHRPRLALMFTGAHTFAELGPAWTDRFISARRVRVSFLTPDEVRPLLTEPIPEFDMRYAPGALEAILAATNGQPFLTQAVAFELVQFLNEQSRKEATPEDVETAIARALVSGGEYFANFWSDAGADGQVILRAIARGETPPDLPIARTWLREHDVLTDAGAFAVPMVERWVREKFA